MSAADRRRYRAKRCACHGLPAFARALSEETGSLARSGAQRPWDIRQSAPRSMVWIRRIGLTAQIAPICPGFSLPVGGELGCAIIAGQTWALPCSSFWAIPTQTTAFRFEGEPG